MQHERIGISTQLGDDERDALRHQAGNEGHIAREPVELRYQDTATGTAGCRQGGGKLGPAIERVGAFAGFHLGVFSRR